jgi:HAE1 family hydrophobic/amphiphilic exporter-1
MLTMLGFIILIGTVVNNAILIVHQTLNNIRNEGMDERRAIVESVRTRIRPIFMSTLTTVLGMLPLVLPVPTITGGQIVWISGAGSELYRGLGSVVLGGLIVSTMFTLILVPVGFSLALDVKKLFAWMFGFTSQPQEDTVPPQPDTPVLTAGTSASRLNR